MRLPEPRETKVHGRTRWLVRVPKVMGGRRHYFDTKEQAEKKIAQFRKTANSTHREFALLSSSQQAVVIGLIAHFDGDMARLKRAAERGEKLLVSTKDRPMADVITECLKAKAESNIRPYYLKMLTYVLELFRDECVAKDIQEVATEHIEKWFSIHKWSPRTRLSNLSFLRVLFSYAVKRRYVASNPVKDMELPIIEHRPPVILTVKQAGTLMENCVKRDKALAPFLAIQLFAGIRPHEARRLSWADVQNGHIRIDSSKSKTRRRRLVTVTPTLKAWLKLGGELPPKQKGQYIYERIKRLTLDAKGKTVVPWSHDVLRHTAASMMLPKIGAWKTALELGHSEQVLFRHYRELVTAADADSFFRIRPMSRKVRF